MIPNGYPTGFQWHHAVHQKWGSEDLWFSFMSFEPTYDRVAATNAVVKALEELGSVSYVVYELTGQYDMLVRAWIPRAALDRYESAMEEIPLGGIVAVSMRTGEVTHHWVWQSTERSEITAMRFPDDSELATRASAGELELLNELQVRSMDGETAFTTNEQALLDRYKRASLLSFPPYETGVKFVTLVKVGYATARNRQALRSRIIEALNGARGVIWDRSMYFCRHQMEFIIFGRVRLDASATLGGAESFHSISSRLLDEISRVAASSGTKTYTYFFPLPGFLAFRDEIPIPPRPKHRKPRFTDLFRTEESHEFEVKGSAFTDLDAWLKGRGELAWSDKPDSVPLRSLLFAIGSLLNGEGGGTVLLGAIEPRVYGKFERAQGLARRDKYLLMGLEADLKDGEWDDFSRHLWQMLATHIAPDPRRWLTLWPSEIEGKPMAAITVETPDAWFYVRAGRRESKFVVRNNAGTQELHGEEITKFQSRHPRGY